MAPSHGFKRTSSEGTDGGNRWSTPNPAARITKELRAQPDIVSQLTGRSTTEEIRVALDHWIEKTKSDPAIQKKVEVIRTQIEREAQTRRNAIAAIFGGDDNTTDETEASAPSVLLLAGGKPAGE